MIALILTVIVTSRSLLHPEFFRVHDYIHGARIAEMSRALLHGHIPVRWSANFGYGYGMPLFSFYAPLPYLIGSLVYLLSGNLLLSVKALWLIPSVVGFLGAYLLGKRLYGFWGGLVAAVLFSLAPYRAVNLFVRGAIGEIWGVMFFPWVLYGLLLIVQRVRHGWSIATLSLIGVILSHNLMTLMFFPFAFILAGISWLLESHRMSRLDRVQTGIGLVGAFALSIVSTLFYTLPALLEKNFTQVEERILSGYFHYSQHFLYIRQFFKPEWQYGGSQWGPDDDMSFFLGHVQIALLFASLLAVLVVVVTLWRKILAKTCQASYRKLLHAAVRVIQPYLSARHALIAVLFPSLAVSLFLTLHRSIAIWDAISPLQVAQFPWRFLSLSLFFIAMIGGWAVSRLASRRLIMVVTFVVIGISSVVSWQYFQPESYLNSSTELYYSDPDRIQQQMSDILPDFIPAGLDPALPPKGERVYDVRQGDAQLVQTVSKTHYSQYQVSVRADATITLPIAWFPGWSVWVNGTRIDSHPNEQGLLEFDLPIGESTVEAVFERTPTRQLADTLSLLGMLAVVSIALAPMVTKNKEVSRS